MCMTLDQEFRVRKFEQEQVKYQILLNKETVHSLYQYHSERHVSGG